MLFDVAKRIGFLLLAAFAIVVLATVSRGAEPPQCNLPGWGVAKQALTTRDLCRCGVSCPCADETKTKAKAYATEKRYVRIGNRLFVQDVLVEVSQPPAVSYAAAPARAVTYQNPTMDCSSGTCRYVR